jgi:hypothetical protein
VGHLEYLRGQGGGRGEWIEQQKKFEAELARQAEIGKARAEFLRDLVDPVWQFQLLALQVSYDSQSDERFQAALARIRP